VGQNRAKGIGPFLTLWVTRIGPGPKKAPLNYNVGRLGVSKRDHGKFPQEQLGTGLATQTGGLQGRRHLKFQG